MWEINLVVAIVLAYAVSRPALTLGNIVLYGAGLITNLAATVMALYQGGL